MFFSHASSTLDNRLLAAIPHDVYQRLAPYLEPIALSPQQILFSVGDPISHVYFPGRSLVSLTNLLSDGSTLEVGLVGSEGLVGVPVILGKRCSQQQVIVQIAEGLPSDALRLPSSILQAEFERGGPFQALLLRYIQALLLQTSQLAACHRFHSVRERLARQLLQIQHAIQQNELLLTQECLAQMLGTRRSGVTVAAGDMSQLGLIRYSRGRITLLQPEGLQAIACECFSVIQTEFDRVLKPL